MSDVAKIYVELINFQYPMLVCNIRVRSGIYCFIYHNVWLGYIFTEDGTEKRHYMYSCDLDQYKLGQLEMNLKFDYGTE